MNTDIISNEFTFTEDEIADAATNIKYKVKHSLVEQYKTIDNLKTLLQNDDSFSPIILSKIDCMYLDDYNIFRMCCPKAWKEFMDVANKKIMEYFEREEQKKAAKAKLPWYKRIFAW